MLRKRALATHGSNISLTLNFGSLLRSALATYYLHIEYILFFTDFSSSRMTQSVWPNHRGMALPFAPTSIKRRDKRYPQLSYQLLGFLRVVQPVSVVERSVCQHDSLRMVDKEQNVPQCPANHYSTNKREALWWEERPASNMSTSNDEVDAGKKNGRS